MELSSHARRHAKTHGLGKTRIYCFLTHSPSFGSISSQSITSFPPGYSPYRLTKPDREIQVSGTADAPL